MALLPKKKALDRKIKAVLERSNARKKLIQESLTENENEKLGERLGEGLRLVNLIEMGKNLKCHTCQSVLDLKNTVKERLIGCHAVLIILCRACRIFSNVNTSRMLDKNVSEINAGFVLGDLHCAAKETALDEILACANVLPTSNGLYQSYEKLTGDVIEEEAKASCKRGAMEEIQLVIEKIEKLTKEL